MAKAQFGAEQKKRAVELAYAMQKHIESTFGEEYNPSEMVKFHAMRKELEDLGFVVIWQAALDAKTWTIRATVTLYIPKTPEAKA